MALKPFHFLSQFIFLLLLSPISHANAKRDIPSGEKPPPFQFIKQLEGYQKGNTTKGIHQLKAYLQNFGYLNQYQVDSEDSDFDDSLESAIKTYQKNYHIEPTGILDAATVSAMITPRCGVPDIINGTNYMQSNHGSSSHKDHFHTVSHYNLFPRTPRWPPSKTDLTYSFSPGFPSEAIDPVGRAFQIWASATQYFTFSQTDQDSDITVGFFRGEHGDEDPFDGRGGILAHSFAPTDGRFHYDADESWSDGAVPGSVDYESVAVHEIGHLLGLGHSDVPEAIMYPTIPPGVVKLNIQSDDINGFRALYKN